MRARPLPSGLAIPMAVTLFLGVALAASSTVVQMPPTPDFDPQADQIPLHYDHAPDKDDGQSVAADRTLLESSYGRDWDGTVSVLVDSWRTAIEEGGDVWVQEGGQSDLTAAVLQQLDRETPDLQIGDRVHVIQHSNWNEEQTTPEALAYVKAVADFIRIPDANAFVNVAGGDTAFEAAARAHPTFGPIWEAAFAYYDPAERLDFSDTGELLFLLGFGQMPIDEFRERFLDSE